MGGGEKATEHAAGLTPGGHELTAYRPICSLDGNKLAAEHAGSSSIGVQKACVR